MTLPQPYQVSEQFFDGLTPEESADLNELIRIWNDKLEKNSVRRRYYDARNRIKDLGISIPPALLHVETVVGWPAKAVDALAVRSIFDGVTATGDAETWLDGIMHENEFDLMYQQAVTSELISSCSFATLSNGVADEPEVLISFYSALTAAAKWDVRRKRIRCGFTISDYDERQDGTCELLAITYYTSDSVIECEKVGNVWRTSRKENPAGRPLMEPLRYRPSLERPFGKSRISRAVRSITDSAVRTSLRTEIAAELYTTPQRYLLGADENTFRDSGLDERMAKVKAYLGNIFAITPNENGDIPQYGQLSQMTMQPHIDYFRSLAARFAGETGIPVASLGIIHDNPASAEALRAASEDLIIEAESLNRTNRTSIENIVRLALALRDGVTEREIKERYPSVYANFENPMRPSVATTTDAAQKQLAMFDWMRESDAGVEIVLEELGYDKSQIARLLQAKRGHDAQSTLMEVLGVNDDEGSGRVQGQAAPSEESGDGAVEQSA